MKWTERARTKESKACALNGKTVEEGIELLYLNESSDEQRTQRTVSGLML